MRSILPAILLAFAMSVTPSKAAANLPAEVQSAIDEARESCDQTVKFEKGFLRRRVFRDDDIAVFILDYGKYICGEDTSTYCGSSGCWTQVFVSSDWHVNLVLDENVEYIEFKMLDGRPAMVVELHGTVCGRSGDQPCSKTLYWNGGEFSPAN